MKNCWTLLFLAAILQTLSVTVLAGNHNHGGGSNIAQILAAGLIVQLLARGHNSHHHHGHGRHSGAEIHSLLSPYAQGYGEESRHVMTSEASMASSSWAQRAPMDIAYSQSQYREPVLESYNLPYFYQPPHPGMWRMN